jgi:hypothetical protein
VAVPRQLRHSLETTFLVDFERENNRGVPDLEVVTYQDELTRPVD